MKKIKGKYKQYGEWQQKPHQVMPLSEESHDCPTCGTHFTGNYCPRCGQSAKIGRYSFKKALLLFLDVWGLGNRGMFRTLRDLILRPGYMIRDYLQGMQMAYFPPFKMFFLLVTLSILVDSGLNIQGVNHIKENHDMLEKIEKAELAHQHKENAATKAKTGNQQVMTPEEQVTGKESDEKVYQVLSTTIQLIKKGYEWFYQYLSIFSIILLLLLSGPLYLMFRHCPAIPDISYSEFFVAMVYTNNMFEIYNIVLSILCVPDQISCYFILLPLIPLKQLTGFSYWRTALKALVGVIICFILLFILAVAIGYIVFLNYI